MIWQTFEFFHRVFTVSSIWNPAVCTFSSCYLSCFVSFSCIISLANVLLRGRECVLISLLILEEILLGFYSISLMFIFGFIMVSCVPYSTTIFFMVFTMFSLLIDPFYIDKNDLVLFFVSPFICSMTFFNLQILSCLHPSSK